MKRKAVLVASGFFFGAFVSFYLEVREIIIFMAVVMVCLCLALFMPESKRRVCLTAALSILLSSAYSLITTVSRLAPLEAMESETASVKGIVTDYSDSDRAFVTISGEVNGIPTKLVAYINNFNGEFGDEISFVGRVSSLEDSPYFSTRNYYLPDGVFVSATVTDNLFITQSEPTMLSLIRLYSRSVSEKIRYHVGGSAGEVLSAMICGDSSSVSDRTRLILNRAGIGHIGAVSGLHLSAVAFALIFVLRKLRCNRIFTAVVAETGIVAFVLFSGARISCIRAAIMMSVYILSTLVKRKSDPLNTLSVAALLIMLANPYAAADVSFCLSLTGTFGVSVAAPYVIKLLKLNNSVLKGFIVCTCASVCTMPFVILNFNELSLAAPLMNLVLVPICSAALVLGMIFCACGAVSSLSWIVMLAGKLMEIVIAACEKVSSFEISYLATGHADAFVCVTVIIVLASVSFILVRSRKLVVMSVLIGFCFFVCTSALNIGASETVRLDILTSGSNSCVLLRKNEECIIIDFDGGKMADECEYFIEKNGISSVRAVMIAENGEAGYSAYLDLSSLPDAMYLPKDSYIFSGRVDYYRIPESLGIFGLDVRLKDNLLIVSYDGKSIAVSKEDYFGIGTQANICILNGVCVVNANEQQVYKGDAIITLKLT